MGAGTSTGAAHPKAEIVAWAMKPDETLSDLPLDRMPKDIALHVLEGALAAVNDVIQGQSPGVLAVTIAAKIARLNGRKLSFPKQWDSGCVVGRTRD